MQKAIVVTVFFVCLITGVVGVAVQDARGARTTKCILDPTRDCKQCTQCKDHDNCCCRHVDRCACNIPTAGKACK